MKISFLQFLDKYVGLPLCVLLTIIKKMLPSREQRIEKDTVKKILIMKFWGLGSILLLSPTVLGCRKTFPHARLVFLTLSKNNDVTRSLNLFDEIITLDVDHGWLFFVRTLAASILYFWRERFDLVIDSEFFTRFSAIITFLTFARVTVGYHSWETWRGDIHTIKVPFNRYWHIMDNFYNLGTRLGMDKNTSLEIVKPVITKDDQKIVDDLMAENGLSRGCVAVHANVSDLSVERRWPYKNFEQLIERLLLHYPIQVVFIGAKSERESVREIISNIHCQGIADLVGKLTISQLAYFFENAKLVIANDSGPLHLAVAMGTPTVSFFGPETPLIYGPRGEHHTVFFKNTDCSPCMNVHNRKSVQCYWRTPACMEAITVDEVYAVVQAKLS